MRQQTRIWRAALLRLNGWLGLRNHDLDVSDEFHAHLQFHIDDNLRAGMTPDEARRDALLRFGGVGLAWEQHRDRRGVPGLDALIRDVRYAARLLRKHPAFTGAAILTLALGIGANTAMFSLADATAFRPPDVPRAAELVRLFTSSRDAKYGEIAETPQPYLFLPFAQRFRPMMTMVVLAKGDPASLAEPIRAEVQAIGANVPAFDIRTLDNVYQARAMVPARLTSLVMISLGLLGTILAVVGLYGVMAYLTSLRKREIGVRMAIGADRWSVVRLVLQQAVGVVCVGLAAGVVLSLAATPLLAVPFDFRPRDAAVMIVVPLILMGATLAATLVPAFRAAMTDPAAVLRDE